MTSKSAYGIKVENDLILLKYGGLLKPQAKVTESIIRIVPKGPQALNPQGGLFEQKSIKPDAVSCQTYNWWSSQLPYGNIWCEKELPTILNVAFKGQTLSL